VRRAGFLAMRRNAAIAMGNSGERSFATHLREWAEAADTGLRAAAQWALRKLDFDLTPERTTVKARSKST
jgi:epoxyqueuosine reductase